MNSNNTQQTSCISTLYLSTDGSDRITIIEGTFETFGSIAQRVYEVTGTAIASLRIIEMNTVRSLEDGRSVFPYHIQNGHASLNDDGSMKLDIESPFNSIIKVHVELSDTIKNVKQKIEDEEGIPTEQQCLFLNHEELDDNRSLSDHDAIIILVGEE